MASAPNNDRPCSNSWADALIIVISGPGGVGKGAIVDALLKRDHSLWLSRSWTTRPHRPGESPDAYVFTTREAFGARIAAGGFLEWTDFLGSYYGTPTPSPPPGSDVVLEIEVDGAHQIRSRYPDALLIFVLPPSREEQRRRLQQRGDDPQRVAARLRKAEEEEPIGKSISDYVVVNDDLDRTIDELVAIITTERRRRGAA